MPARAPAGRPVLHRRPRRGGRLGRLLHLRRLPLPGAHPPAHRGRGRGHRAAPEAQAEEEGRYSPTPGVRITRTRARGAVDQLGADLEGPPIEAAFNGVPIVAFINEVFGTQLGMSFVISPGLQEKTGPGHPAPHQPGAAAPVLQHRPPSDAGVRRRHPRAGRGARLPRHLGDRIRRSAAADQRAHPAGGAGHPPDGVSVGAPARGAFQ